MSGEAAIQAARALSALDVFEHLRTIDCVSVDACYKPHGTAHFVYLGEGDNRRIVGQGDTFIDALYNAWDRTVGD